MFREVKRARWVLVLVGVLIAGLLLSRNFIETSSVPPAGELSTVEATEAGEHVGEMLRVCGRVVEATFARQVGGRPTFLNFGGRYPNPEFTVVIWDAVRRQFEAPPEDLYRDRRICVRGRIQLHEGTPQIEVESPGQVALVATDPG